MYRELCSVLISETPQCTSGVDPLSRRALWRTLTSVRHDRTVVFTTHVRLLL